jgi:hydroxycarboxylate dehydrogenase B
MADFHTQVAALLDWVRSAPLAAGATEILIPGEPEARMERERRAAGVPIEDATWRQIQDVAVEAGVDA